MLTETMTTDATETGDDNVYCELCEAALTDAEIDESGYLCSTCFDKTHFACTDCSETLDNEDKSPKCRTRCLGCQESKDEEQLEGKKDALRSEAEDLLASILVDGDLPTLKKTVAALKRFQPT